MAHDVIDRLAEAHERELTDELLQALAQALAAFDLELIAAALDDTDADHIRQQLELILDLDDTGLPRSISTDLDPAADRLASYIDAIAAHAAAEGSHTLNPGNAILRLARAAGPALIALYLGDTGRAFTATIDAVIRGDGTAHTKARQLVRSLGLSIKQAEALAVMRTALRTYLASPRVFVPAYIDADGVRIPAAYVRRVNVAKIIGLTRGRISAAQTRLLIKAIGDENLTEAQAEAILDQHAAKLRSYRSRVVAGEGIHSLTEQAKLTGWQIAQAAGALPQGQHRYWQTAGDERVRLTHAEVPLMNPNGVALDQPFATPLGPCMHPPLEYGCRCKAVLARSA